MREFPGSMDQGLKTGSPVGSEESGWMYRGKGSPSSASAYPVSRSSAIQEPSAWKY
jgi:hypothetical protein